MCVRVGVLGIAPEASQVLGKCSTLSYTRDPDDPHFTGEEMGCGGFSHLLKDMHRRAGILVSKASTSRICIMIVLNSLAKTL